MIFHATILEVILIAGVGGFVGFLTAFKGGARMGYGKGYKDGYRKGHKDGYRKGYKDGYQNLKLRN